MYRNDQPETLSNGDRSIGVELTEAEKKAAEEHKTLIGYCEKFLLLLLGQPDQTLKHSNAGSYIKEELGIESANEWVEVNKELIVNRGLISASKSQPGSQRPDVYKLEMPDNPEVLGLEYITDEVIEVIKRQAPEPSV